MINERIQIINNAINGIQKQAETALNQDYLNNVHQINEKYQKHIEQYEKQRYKGGNLLKSTFQQIINTFSYGFSEAILVYLFLIFGFSIVGIVPFWISYEFSENFIVSSIVTMLFIVFISLFSKEFYTFETTNYHSYEYQLDRLRKGHQADLKELQSGSTITSNSPVFNFVISKEFIDTIIDLSDEQMLASVLNDGKGNITIKDGLNLLYHFLSIDKTLALASSLKQNTHKD